MNQFEKIQHSFLDHIKNEYKLSEIEHGIECTINTDHEKEQFGDINSNAALVLSKSLKQNPRIIAQELVNNFKNDLIEKIEIAGPGFLNFFLKKEAFELLAKELTTKKSSFFSTELKQKHNYNVEFVSANPTGPLHIGHGRGGIIGDVLSKILVFLGHNVAKEFYTNDAGLQMQKLGLSLKTRCLQKLGEVVNIPEGGYQGEYLVDLAKECIKENGEKIKTKPDCFFTEYAHKKMLNQLKKTLEKYGIDFDVWFSEETLHKSGKIKDAIEVLEKNKFVYEKDGAVWFKSKEFGDDKDRVLKKSDGQYTYVAADTAYLEDKSDRGFDKLIMILGQDHHSYLVRLNAIKDALGIKKCSLDIILYQLVTLKESGQLLRMSKRAGTMVTLQDVIDAVGTDVARFFYLNRKADAHLDFDIDLAMKKTDENPVYYIQYAYVRTISIIEKAKNAGLKTSIYAAITQINNNEKVLLRKITSLKHLLEHIGKTYQTHLLTYYVHELAQEFHRYYNKNRVIDLEDVEQSKSRLAIIHILKNTFDLCLDLLGLSKPEKM